MDDEGNNVNTRQSSYTLPNGDRDTTPDTEFTVAPGQWPEACPEVWDTGEDNHCPPPIPQPQVYIRVVFLKIGEIDTMKEQFSADVFIQARWREPSLDHSTERNVDDVNWTERWNPKLLIQNVASDQKQSVWFDVQFNEGQAFVLEKRRLKGWFTENLELEAFPFDIQHLSLMITSDLSSKEVTLVEDDLELSSVNRLSFIDEQEWEMRNFVELLPQVTKREYSSAKHEFPSVLVRCCAFRRPGFFIWNILCVMCLISSLSFSTFSVDQTKPQNRLQLSFTLVLTGVAFKFVATQSLPKIPYLTYLDRYILISMCIMYFVCIWHAVITRFQFNDSLSRSMDFWAFVGLVGFFVCFQLFFIFTARVNSAQRRMGVYDAEEKYRMKADELQGIDANKKRWKLVRGKTKFRVGVL
ncbi:cys-loop ligand-gated ion channel-like isoform X1 [Haliotis rufescens]|uniref:cys-loop ligand-gated ion channel-like isoform X1 n=1 Tax=Haliotis rufescens TaxID=6454 RepID=UPI001EB097F2|nr:cys-loop ligand-gated ion channel-like isoform X1 [Haliotis rufescens]